MRIFWKVVGGIVISGIIVNGVANTVSRVRRDKIEDEDYRERIKEKREEKKKAKQAKKSGQPTEVTEEAK
jgi:hypothetical protein